MTKLISAHRVLTVLTGLVWLINGLFCKVLNFVPRHQQIVARILGDEYSAFFTKTIGFSEILVFAWVLSGIRSRWCALFQICTVALMNAIEFLLAPDLLLFGKLNSVVALFFILVVYVNEFHFNKQKIS